MNISNFVDCWENEISDLVLKYYNSEDSRGLEELTKLFFIFIELLQNLIF